MHSRRLIEEGLIPEDVTVGVLVPSIERHIIRSFEALRGSECGVGGTCRGAKGIPKNSAKESK